MIGLKLQNFIWEKALCALLGERAEKWQAGHCYFVVLTDLDKGALKNFQAQEKAPLIGLGKTTLPVTLSLPIKKTELEKYLAPATAFFENQSFWWEGKGRRLINKKTKKVISLTEKENNILTYLLHQPHHQATPKELLHHVWHYTKGTESHTVESTVYTLRQKIGKNANQLILPTPTGYRLV